MVYGIAPIQEERMTEEAGSGAVKGSIWKYFGAMMMESKAGKMAVSFTRTLALVTYTAWIIVNVHQYAQTGEIPAELTYVLLALIGIKGAKDVANGLKGQA